MKRISIAQSGRVYEIFLRAIYRVNNSYPQLRSILSSYLLANTRRISMNSRTYIRIAFESLVESELARILNTFSDGVMPANELLDKRSKLKRICEYTRIYYNRCGRVSRYFHIVKGCRFRNECEIRGRNNIIFA